MENQARTLAYNLAKELDHNELEEVSGGANSWVSCQRPTLTASGGGRSFDSSIDVVIDW